MAFKKIIRIIKKKDKESDFDFWQTQSYRARLETLENIRSEYNTWKYGDKQRFQYVISIIKRKGNEIHSLILRDFINILYHVNLIS